MSSSKPDRETVVRNASEAVEAHGERAISLVADRRRHAGTDEAHALWAAVYAEIEAMQARGEAPKARRGPKPKHAEPTRRVQLVVPKSWLGVVDDAAQAGGQNRTAFLIEAGEALATARKHQRSG